MINDRMSTILDAVVHLYIDNAEPVSSEMILTFYNLPVSSATIRNDLLLLEKLGYIKSHILLPGVYRPIRAIDFMLTN